ncbi:MAG: ABC transporter ATP-binding protein [Syntrophomonadaceae bacterium]
MTFSLRHIDIRFGDLLVLHDLSMEVEEHKLTCILGPSGAGKTTLLNLISGSLQPQIGQIEGFEGKSISYLFQETRLLRWKTAEDNIDFVLKDHLSKTQRVEAINRYIEMVGLNEFRRYYPDQLSGGMKQRVAIARAFAFPSDILLMDEPFKGLDLQLKTSLMQAFINVWLTDKRSVFFVTHDLDEALLLGEEIFVLTPSPGKVKGVLINSIPHKDRDLNSPQLRSIKDRLYQLVTT